MEIEDYLDDKGLKGLREQVQNEVGKGSKRRVGETLGANLERSQIPDIFERVLTAAIDLATGNEVPDGN